MRVMCVCVCGKYNKILFGASYSGWDEKWILFFDIIFFLLLFIFLTMSVRWKIQSDLIDMIYVLKWTRFLLLISNWFALLSRLKLFCKINTTLSSVLVIFLEKRLKSRFISLENSLVCVSSKYSCNVSLFYSVNFSTKWNVFFSKIEEKQRLIPVIKSESSLEYLNTMYKHKYENEKKKIPIDFLVDIVFLHCGICSKNQFA